MSDQRSRKPPEDELGDFGDWADINRDRLEDRSCVKKDKRPWYGWHENPTMKDILQPKLLCQDIAESPQFWIDTEGDVVPKHTVYYLIPKDHVDLEELAEYLNGPEASAWLEANCQWLQTDSIGFRQRLWRTSLFQNGLGN